MNRIGDAVSNTSGRSSAPESLPVNVFYLLAENGKPFFYYDESEAKRDGANSSSSGLWKWAERKLQEIEDAKDDPNGGVTARVGKVWAWLRSLSYPDEAMFAQFAYSDEVALRYPASRSEESVKRAWRKFLRRRRRRHLFWGIVDAFLIPFGALLTILPGPNVIGYWLVYRTGHHFLTYWRLRRVLKKQVPTRFKADDALNEPISRDDDETPRHDALPKGARLDEYLKRLHLDDDPEEEEKDEAPSRSDDSTESQSLGSLVNET